MRIAHLGDLHLSEGPRFDMTLSCLQFALEASIAADVDVFLVGGDLAGTTVPHRATVREEQALADLFIAMADHAPVIICRGNHCGDDIGIYHRLVGRHSIAVAQQPAIITVNRDHLNAFRIYVMPFPQKRWLLAQSIQGTIEEQNVAYENGLRDILASWRVDAAEARERGEYTAGLMHLTVAGSKIGGGEVLLPGVEISLAPHDLDELGFDVVCLSHIHLFQKVASRAWYAGSPSAQNFGEPDEKGFLLIDVPHPGDEPQVTRVLTPSRGMVTVEGVWDDHLALVVFGSGKDTQGAEVRLRVAVPEEHAVLGDGQAEMERERLISQGAYSVKVERRVIPRERVRSEAMTLAVTLEDQARAFWESLGENGPSEEQRARCLGKLAGVAA
jgi:DNA repair exonuclease SbcCD nuclease subunit